MDSIKGDAISTPITSYGCKHPQINRDSLYFNLIIHCLISNPMWARMNRAKWTEVVPLSKYFQTCIINLGKFMPAPQVYKYITKRKAIISKQLITIKKCKDKFKKYTGPDRCANQFAVISRHTSATFWPGNMRRMYQTAVCAWFKHASYVSNRRVRVI